MPDESTVEPAAPDVSGAGIFTHPFTRVPIEITVCVGKARPSLRDLLSLKRESILPLESRVADLVDLYVGERLIARGELQELDGDQTGQLAVKLTEVVDTKNG